MVHGTQDVLVWETHAEGMRNVWKTHVKLGNKHAQLVLMLDACQLLTIVPSSSSCSLGYLPAVFLNKRVLVLKNYGNPL